MRLWWHPFSLYPRRVRVVVREKGLACEEAVVDLPAGATRAPAFARLNPFGQVPVLEDDGLVVAGSLAIMEYLEERHPAPPLLPRDLAARARARQLMGWSGDYLGPAFKRWLAQMFEPPEKLDHADVAAARVEIAAHLDVLEGVLAPSGDYLVGELSLADAAYVPFVVEMAAVGLGDLLDARPRVDRWVVRLRERASVRATTPGMP
jgi:glutathione S-transferase